jgi:hypothetical protein
MRTNLASGLKGKPQEPGAIFTQNRTVKRNFEKYLRLQKMVKKYLIVFCNEKGDEMT